MERRSEIVACEQGVDRAVVDLAVFPNFVLGEHHGMHGIDRAMLDVAIWLVAT